MDADFSVREALNGSNEGMTNKEQETDDPSICWCHKTGCAKKSKKKSNRKEIKARILMKALV